MFNKRGLLAALWIACLGLAPYHGKSAEEAHQRQCFPELMGQLAGSKPVMTAASRELSAQSSEAALIFRELFGFEDPSLAHQLLIQSKLSPEDVLQRSGNVLAFPKEWAPLLKGFVQSVSPHGVVDAATLQKIRAGLESDPAAKRLLQGVLKGVSMEAHLAPFEGQAFGAQFLNAKDLGEILDSTRTMGRVQNSGRVSRQTPVGVSTDETQYVMLGLISSLNGEANFAKSYVANWHLLHNTDSWRNVGARTADYLSGSTRALAKDVMVGDLTRVIPFLALSKNPAAMTEQLHVFGKILGFSEEKTRFLESFTVALKHHFDGNEKLATASFDRLIERSREYGAYMPAFLKSTRDHLIAGDDVGKYFAETAELGKDLDTFAFYAGLLSKKPVDLTRLKLDGVKGWETYVNVATSSMINRTVPVQEISTVDHLQEFLKTENAISSDLRKLRSGENPR